MKRRNVQFPEDMYVGDLYLKRNRKQTPLDAMRWKGKEACGICAGVAIGRRAIPCDNDDVLILSLSKSFQKSGKSLPAIAIAEEGVDLLVAESVMPEEIDVLTKFDKVKGLYIKDSPDLDDDSIAKLSTMQELEALSLHCGLTDDNFFHYDKTKTKIKGIGIEKLSLLPKLRALRLNFGPHQLHYIGSSQPTKHKIDLTILKQFENLTELDLRDVRMTSEIIDSIACLNKLTKLSVQWFNENIVKLKELRILEVAGHQMNGYKCDRQKFLEQLPELECLVIGGWMKPRDDDKWSTDQNGIDLKRLLSIPRLKKIIIREGLAEGEKNFVSLVNPSPEWKVQDLVSDCYIKDTLTFKNRYRFSCTFVRL